MTPQNPLRVVLVDDELLACERLRMLLANEPDVQVMGKCFNGSEALSAIRRELPDLVFLDIHMPGMDGMEVLNALSQSPLPLVVIVTAHEKYAVPAFEAQVVDYLLKPLDLGRLQETLKHARKRLQSVLAAQFDKNIATVLSYATEDNAPMDRISVRTKGRIVFVKLDDIDWIGTAENYLELHLGKTTHQFFSTLNAFERRLPPKRFVRISRSMVVNFSHVKGISFHKNGDGIVHLLNGVQLSFSRRYRRKLCQFNDEK